jgi:cytochrome c oxidase subunit IV
MKRDRSSHRDQGGDFARRARGLALVWLALIALMLASLGSAYLRLGVGNLIAGLVIATLKSGLVAWCFMELRRASSMSRIAAAVGLVMLLLLMALAMVDYATRRSEPAAWQSPRQIAPLLEAPPRRH